MANTSGSTQPLWFSSAEIPVATRLESDAEADVCVVGAGIAGLSTAYELTRRGLSVIVIDQARIGDGMTGRTTAHFTNAFDDRYFEVERLHGEEAARLVAESHTAAIERTAEIAARESIDCELERLDGWLFAPPRRCHRGPRARARSGPASGARGCRALAARPAAVRHGPGAAVSAPAPAPPARVPRGPGARDRSGRRADPRAHARGHDRRRPRSPRPDRARAR